MGFFRNKPSSTLPADLNLINQQQNQTSQNSASKTETGYAKILNRSLAPKSVAESSINFFELVTQTHCDSLLNVRAGHLLKWMDIAACMAAEKHSQCNCVTLSMDDLSFESPAKLGDVLEITARITNSFNTSCEIAVVVSSISTNSEKTHTRGFFTFVALDHNGAKAIMPKIIPTTEDERDDYILAKERRDHRFNRKALVEKYMTMPVVPVSSGNNGNSSRKNSESNAAYNLGSLLLEERTSELTFTPSAPLISPGGKRRKSSIRNRNVLHTENSVSTSLSPHDDNDTEPHHSNSTNMKESSIEMTKIVLPQDSNHMGNTFGGNIMSWMDDAATVACIKHCHHPSSSSSNHGGVYLTTISVDAMSFLGPSKTGDRITLKAQVNRAFGSTMEVGVRVEAQALGGDLRHVNTGYLTIHARSKPEANQSSTGELTLLPLKLPRVIAQTNFQKTQFDKAMGRRRLRIERKKLNTSTAGGKTWNWSEDLKNEISTANVYGLLHVANSGDLAWMSRSVSSLVGKVNRFHLTMEVNASTPAFTSAPGLSFMRVCGVVSCDMESMFKLLMDVGRRKEWDAGVVGEIVCDIDEMNDIELRSYDDDKGKIDYKMLRTWRFDEDRYILSYRSINHPSDSKITTAVKDKGEVSPYGLILTEPYENEDDKLYDFDDHVHHKKVSQTNFDLIVQLDEGGGGGGGEGVDSDEIKAVFASLIKLCVVLEDDDLVRRNKLDLEEKEKNDKEKSEKSKRGKSKK